MPETTEPSTDDDLLVAAPESWRDACFSMPAVRSLAASGRRLTLLCPDRQAAFWVAAGFTELCCHPDGAPARKIAPLLGGFRSVLLWEAGPRAEACARAGIARRLGTSGPGLDRLLSEVLERNSGPGPARHAVQRFLETAARLGAEPMQAAHFEPIPAADPAPRTTVLAIPGSGFGRHFEWPVERWTEVVDGLKARGRSVTIGVTGEGGDDPGAAVAGATGCDPVALDPSRPAELAGYGLCLAADGPMPHLAAAFGTTCAVLFGPGDPVLHRPLGRMHRILRRKVECSPCFAARCPLDLRCQRELDAATVLEAALELTGA